MGGFQQGTDTGDDGLPAARRSPFGGDVHAFEGTADDPGHYRQGKDLLQQFHGFRPQFPQDGGGHFTPGQKQSVKGAGGDPSSNGPGKGEGGIQIGRAHV